MVELSKQQTKAYDKIMTWYNESDKDTFVLSGYSGVGKSTLIAKLYTEFYDPGVGSFTGKAVHVLRKKGITKAKTLHCLAYVSACNVLTGKIDYIELDRLAYSSLIVDEASMVPKELYNVFKDFKIKKLYVGDGAQLPPINNKGEKAFNVMDNCDFLLSEIHRQNADNPIIKMSMDIRYNDLKDINSYGSNIRLINAIECFHNLEKYDQIICATNKIRFKVNNLIRAKLGFNKNTPQINDRVICLRNTKEYGVFNGQQFKVVGVETLDKKLGYIVLKLYDEDTGRLFRINSLLAPFNQENYNYRIDDCRKKDNLNLCPFDYSYAVTCHKSQGSEYDSILIINDLCYMRSSDQEFKNRWLYTAVTRAIKSVDLIDVSTISPILG